MWNFLGKCTLPFIFWSTKILFFTTKIHWIHLGVNGIGDSYSLSKYVPSTAMYNQAHSQATLGLK